MADSLRTIYKTYRDIILISLTAIPIGIAVGAIDVIFGTILLNITALRDSHPLYFIPFLGGAGILILTIYKKFGESCLKGMNLIFKAGSGNEDDIPLRLIPLIISGTWLTHLFGKSY